MVQPTGRRIPLIESDSLGRSVELAVTTPPMTEHPSPSSLTLSYLKRPPLTREMALQSPHDESDWTE